MELGRFEDDIFFATVRITVPQQSGHGASIGTGFILATPLSESDSRSVALLVSNKHVFIDSSHSIVLNLTKKDPDEPTRPLLGQIASFQADELTGGYYEHPDPEVDLACINISMVTQSPQGVFYKNLQTSTLSDYSENDLRAGTEVWFVGYPENRYDTIHNLPILRRGYIASVPTVDFNARSQIVIDAQVFPGSSGSPVFAALSGQFKLIGVVTETMIRHEELQVVPSVHGVGVQQVLGLGIVLKSTLVAELIASATEEILRQLGAGEGETMAEVSDPTTEPET